MLNQGRLQNLKLLKSITPYDGKPGLPKMQSKKQWANLYFTSYLIRFTYEQWCQTTQRVRFHQSGERIERGFITTSKQNEEPVPERLGV